MIDANMNEARAFLISIIDEYYTEGNNQDPIKNQILELIFKNIILMGIVRSNVEDLLLVATLLDKYNIKIDLREEMEILSRDDTKLRE